MNLEQELEAMLQELRDLRTPTAKAMAEHEYAKEWCKVTKARLVEAYLEHNPKWSHARAETAATADDAYETAVVVRQQAQERALAAQWKMKDLELYLDLWRTQEATKRVEMKAYS